LCADLKLQEGVAEADQVCLAALLYIVYLLTTVSEE